MRTQSLRSRPWVLVTLVGAVVLGIAELILRSGLVGIAQSWLGAVLATILFPIAAEVGLLIGSVVFGLRVRHVIFGAMRELWSIRRGDFTFTVRTLPVTLRAQIGPGKSPVILRCWCAGLVSAIAGFTCVTAAWLVASNSFGRGFALTATAFLAYTLWPQRRPLTTSTGWLLFSLPRMPEPERSDFLAAPLAARAYAALRRGHIDEAAQHAETMAARYPGLNATMSCQVAVLESRGEYAPAVLTLLKYLSENEVPPRQLAYLLAGLAGLGFKAVEAGQLPADMLLPTAKKALRDAIGLGYPEFELNGTRGLLALLEGDADTAVKLATTATEYGHSPLSRADDYATLARAHMARRDNTAARDALAHAEKLAPWPPRVAEVRQRLSVC